MFSLLKSPPPPPPPPGSYLRHVISGLLFRALPKFLLVFNILTELFVWLIMNFFEWCWFWTAKNKIYKIKTWTNFFLKFDFLLLHSVVTAKTTILLLNLWPAWVMVQMNLIGARIHIPWDLPKYKHTTYQIQVRKSNAVAHRTSSARLVRKLTTHARGIAQTHCHHMQPFQGRVRPVRRGDLTKVHLIMIIDGSAVATDSWSCEHSPCLDILLEYRGRETVLRADSVI